MPRAGRSTGRTPRRVRTRERTARPVLSTIHAGRSASDAWRHVVEVVPSCSLSGLVPWLVRFLLAARGRRAVVLRGTVSASEGYRDLLAGVLLRIFLPGLPVVVSDATIEPGSRALARRLPAGAAHLLESLSRLLVRALDSPSVTWCVLSTEEARTFASTWGVSRGRVVFTPFSHSLHDSRQVEGTDDGEHVFSGGNSLRDYGLLLEAWKADMPLLRIATTTTTTTTTTATKSGRSNVVAAPTSPRDFLRLMAGSRLVVLPLQRAARSTGQQTYLNAMLLGRPLVVTDSPGVQDYVEDGVTGLVVTSEPESLREAVRRLLDDPALARRLGEAARRRVLDRYEPHHYRDRLLQVAEIQP